MAAATRQLFEGPRDAGVLGLRRLEGLKGRTTDFRGIWAIIVPSFRAIGLRNYKGLPRGPEFSVRAWFPGSFEAQILGLGCRLRVWGLGSPRHSSSTG